MSLMPVLGSHRMLFLDLFRQFQACTHLFYVTVCTVMMFVSEADVEWDGDFWSSIFCHERTKQKHEHSRGELFAHGNLATIQE